MKKVICLILFVVFAGISIHAQDRKRPEHSRELQGRMKKVQEMRMKREYQDRGMQKELHEMGFKKRHAELENYMSELEFEREMRELELEKARLALEKGEKGSCCGGGCGKWKKGKSPTGVIGHMICCLMFVGAMAIVHILLTVWVFIDIRKRNASGLWVVITLLAGFMGAFLYALIRIGDGKK